MNIHNMPGKVPSEPQQNGVLQILVCGSVLDTVRNARWLELIIWSVDNFFTVYPIANAVHAVSCAGSVVLTQTHPAAPYVCRTGNITLRCQYDGVENVVVVLWLIGGQTTTNRSNIRGHTSLLPTTTYQEVVVDSYISLSTAYRCVTVLHNGSHLQSNQYNPQIECERLIIYE